MQHDWHIYSVTTRAIISNYRRA